MAEATDSLHNTKIKNFEQKVLNQSFCELRFYDKLADYLLECCHAQAKPNTLSLFSFLPLFILSFVVTGPSTMSFIFTTLCLLIHQLLDIANKKQAHRLNQFSLATYYIDHLFDTLSCSCIVLIICRLLELSPSSTLTAIYFFGMLPFYTHHLAMYNNQYMTFSTISPNTEGLIFTKLLFLIATFYPSFFQLQIAPNFYLYQIYVLIAVVWLCVFLFHDMYVIARGNRVTDAKSGTEQYLALKNLFVIFMIGYLVLEMTSIEMQMLQDSVLFYLAFATLTLIFAHIVSHLILAYGYNEHFKQITLPFLMAMGAIVVFYTVLVFGLRGNEWETLCSKIVLGVILGLFLLFFVRESWKNIIHINSVIST